MPVSLTNLSVGNVPGSPRKISSAVSIKNVDDKEDESILNQLSFIENLLANDTDY